MVEWGNICEKVDTCAQTGAAAFFGGIPRAEVLLNGPLWCYFYALRHLEAADHEMGQRFHGSQPDNTAVVYGTEKFLLETLNKMKKQQAHPDILLIENSCAMSLIGDDLSGIAKKAGLDFPVLTMDSGGIVGGFAEGYVKAALTLLNNLQFAKSDDVKTERPSVNILGLSDFYFNGAADRNEIVRILQKCGYTVNCILGSGSDLNEIKNLPKAQYNIVIHEELGREIAKYIEDNFAVPYIVLGMPYGTIGTKIWLEKLNEVIPADSTKLNEVKQELTAVQENLIAWSNEMRGIWGELWFDDIVIAAPTTTAICLAQALRSEWVDTGSLTVICQNEVKHSVLACTMADEILFSNKDSRKINDVLQNLHDALLMGSSSETSIMERQGNSSVCISNIAFPVKDELLITDTPFCGIKGSAHLLQRLWNTFVAFKRRNILQ